LLPSLHDDVSKFRIELDQSRPTPRPLGSDHRGTRAAEWIEDDIAALDELRIARSTSATGFIVGCTSFFA
jgi:hypothetical protein